MEGQHRDKKVAGINEEDLQKVVNALAEANDGIRLAKKLAPFLGSTVKEIERKYEGELIQNGPRRCCRTVLKDLQRSRATFFELCTALKEIGNYDALFLLSPPEEPRVVKQPESVSGRPGTSVTLAVVATGSPRPSFSWFKSHQGGVKAVEEGRYTVLTHGKSKRETWGKLVFTDLHIDDEAQYCCAVSSKINGLKKHSYSKYCRVSMDPKRCGPHILTMTYPKKFCLVGESVELECQALGEPNELTYAWHRNGIRKDTCDRPSMTVNVHGKYHCEVTNEVRSEKSPIIEVFLVSKLGGKDMDDKATAEYFEKNDDLVINAPEDLLSLDASVMESYFQAVLCSSTVESRRVTLMIVGQDRSGKTALAQALIEGLPKVKPNPEVESDSTIGIDINAVMCNLHQRECNFEKISSSELVLRMSDEMKGMDSDSQHLFLKICDFGGQPVFFNSNSCFMSNHGIYLITHNLVNNLEDMAEVQVGMNGKIYKIKEECGTNSDYVKTWISGITMATDPESEEGGPIAISIGTHFDKILKKYPGLRDRMEFLSQKENQINGFASRPPFDQHFSAMDHFYVDSIGHYHYAAVELDHLRRRIVEAAKSDRLYKFDLPCSWLSLEGKVIKEAEKNATGLTTYSRIEEIARECNVTKINGMLKLYHALGSFLWFDEVPQLKETVVTKPQWLLDVFRSVITLAGECVEDSDTPPPYWRELRRSGVVSYTVLLGMLDTAIADDERGVDRESLRRTLFNLLQNFDFIAPYIASEDELDQSSFPNFILPSMIVWDPPVTSFVDIEAKWPEISLLSNHRLVPDALFNRLIVRMVRIHCLSPEVYRHFARFHVDSEHDLLLFNWRGEDAGPRDRIKVMMQRGCGGVEKTSKEQCGEALHDVVNALAETRGYGMQGIRFQLESGKSLLSLFKKPFCKKHVRHLCAEPLCLDSLVRETEKTNSSVWFAHWPKKKSKNASFSIVSGLVADSSHELVKIGVMDDGSDFKQPDDHCQEHFVQFGSGIHLRCQTSGIHPKHTIWYRKGKQLSDNTTADIQERCVTSEHLGLYSSLIRSGRIKRMYSKPVHVRRGGVLLTKKPSVVCKVFKSATKGSEQSVSSLGCKVHMSLIFDRRPSQDEMKLLQFQWHQNNLIIPNAVNSDLEISKVSDHHAGTYRCHIFQKLARVESLGRGELIIESRPAELEVSAPSNWAEEYRRIQETAWSFSGKSRENIVKIALLIGNKRYREECFESLNLTENDICGVADALERLGFTVFAYADLTYCEMAHVMQQFYDNIKKGCYALFYFAGHGYECHGDIFMAPVDGTGCNLNTGFRDKAVDYHMKLNSPRLTVMLLDCCRTSPSGKNKNAVKFQHPGIPSGTGYRQCSCYSATAAYESRNAINSFYASLLLEQLESLEKNMENIKALKSDVTESDMKSEKSVDAQVKEIEGQMTVMSMLENISRGVIEKKTSSGNKVWQTPQTTWYGPEVDLSLADDAAGQKPRKNLSELEDERISKKTVYFDDFKVEVEFYHAVWLDNVAIVGARCSDEKILFTLAGPSLADKNICYEPSHMDAAVSKRLRSFYRPDDDEWWNPSFSFVKIYNHQLYQDPNVSVNLTIKPGQFTREKVDEHHLPKSHLKATSWFNYRH
eukprot:m.16164 g.16164  ORF g.16164 m.16164 type:complete len:1625 (+) comp26761_c0_seq4:48-4922(+)